MATSHADSHDLDKLARWHRDLLAGTSSDFPAFAVFLVGPDDLLAHNIFREFRSSFEGRGAGFEHLVIFGQHGVSSTVRALSAELDLDQEALPVLALFSGPSASAVHTLPLVKGSLDDEPDVSISLADDGAWRDALRRLESAVEAKKPDPDLASLLGPANRVSFERLEALVGQLVKQVS